MLRLRSVIKVADNTGAKLVHMVGIPGRGNKKVATIGDVVTVVVKVAEPHGQVKKGDIVHAVVVRTRKEIARPDGSHIRFDDNACALITEKGVKDPKGTRFFGPLAREVKELGFNKIASMATEIY